MLPEPRRLLIVVALAIIAYGPTLRLPFISDDYSQIPLARQYAAAGWTPLWHDADFRTRATSMVLEAAVDRAFGFNPLPFYVTSILLHAACALLIVKLYWWRELSPQTTFAAACFFAVYEGHQEAVMWISAANDLLVTLFGLLTLLFWMQWLNDRKTFYYLSAVASFALALLSKESAWAIPVFLLLPLSSNQTFRKRISSTVVPFFVIAAGYILWNYLSRVADVRYHDIRFSLLSPWPAVWMRSLWRILLPWGLIALAILIWSRRRADLRNGVLVTICCAFAVLPYSFLTYMPTVPSRHTYLASVGLALLVGIACSSLVTMNHRRTLAVAAVVALMINIEILWVKKMSQYRERAAPSELLKLAAADSSGPVTVECSPLGEFRSRWVLEDVGSHGIFPPSNPNRMDSSCFALKYTDLQGHVIHVRRQLIPQKHNAFF